MQLRDVLPLVTAVATIAVIVTLFVRIAIRLRRRGGSLTTVGFGATYELMNRDRRRASETVLDMNAGKKREYHNRKESK
jgi:hypothetical protein